MATIWDADEAKSSRPSSRESAYTVPAVARPVTSRSRRRLGPGPAIPFGLQIGPALLVLLWVAGSALGWIDPRILSAPWTVIEAFGRLIEQGRLQDNFVTSATRALLGLSIGLVIGTILAVTAGLSRIGEALIDGPCPDQARHPDAGSDPPADPVVRHRRGHEGHDDRPGRDHTRLHPHP
jgi:sulfonate transport system permease protein